MFNDLQHTFYTTINDLKHKLGLVNDEEHVLANLQEEARFHWAEFKDFVIETKDDIVKTVGDCFDNLTHG